MACELNNTKRLVCIHVEVVHLPLNRYNFDFISISFDRHRHEFKTNFFRVSVGLYNPLLFGITFFLCCSAIQQVTQVLLLQQQPFKKVNVCCQTYRLLCKMQLLLLYSGSVAVITILFTVQVQLPNKTYLMCK